MRLSRILGLLWAALGLAIVVWLAVLIYRGSPADDVVMLAIGIPLMLLLTWAGLFLLFGGLARFVSRRR